MSWFTYTWGMSRAAGAGTDPRSGRRFGARCGRPTESRVSTRRTRSTASTPMRSRLFGRTRWPATAGRSWRCPSRRSDRRLPRGRLLLADRERLEVLEDAGVVVVGAADPAVVGQGVLVGPVEREAHADLDPGRVAAVEVAGVDAASGHLRARRAVDPLVVDFLVGEELRLLQVLVLPGHRA